MKRRKKLENRKFKYCDTELMLYGSIGIILFPLGYLRNSTLCPATFLHRDIRACNTAAATFFWFPSQVCPNIACDPLIAKVSFPMQRFLKGIERIEVR